MPSGTMMQSINAGYDGVKVATSGFTLDNGYDIVITNFSSEQNVVLPSASDNPYKKFIIRAKDGSSKCVLQRSGSDTIDDSGSATQIDVNAGKARTIVSDGTSIWYCVTGIGS